MNPVTLYVSDMDGTLLGQDSLLSKRSSHIISALSARGALITVATARTPATVQPLLQDTLTLPPAIIMTGAALWHRHDKTYSNVHFMPEADVEAACAACAGCGIHPFIYTLAPDGMLEVYHNGTFLNIPEQKFYDQRRNLSLKRFHMHSSLPADARTRTILLCALGPIIHTDAAARTLEANTGCTVQSYPDAVDRHTGILEIFAHGVSKASAIERVRTLTGATRVIAFGDNLNDLPMLAAADIAVAVANALPQVRAAADIVIGPNTDDSVARFIHDDFNATAAHSGTRQPPVSSFQRHDSE